MYIMYLFTCGGCTQSFINGQNVQIQTADLYEIFDLDVTQITFIFCHCFLFRFWRNQKKIETMEFVYPHWITSTNGMVHFTSAKLS